MEKYEKLHKITNKSVSTSSMNATYAGFPTEVMYRTHSLKNLSVADLMALLSYLMNEEDIADMAGGHNVTQLEQARDQITLIQQEIENIRKLIFG